MMYIVEFHRSKYILLNIQIGGGDISYLVIVSIVFHGIFSVCTILIVNIMRTSMSSKVSKVITWNPS
jgi:hypothetical protein